MKPMKTESKSINWLSNIDGLTVENAIKYLKTLDQSHRLNFFIDGDTHNINIVEGLLYDVELTYEEALQSLNVRMDKQAKHYYYAIEYYIKKEQPERITNCNLQIEKIEVKRKELTIELKREYNL